MKYDIGVLVVLLSGETIYITDYDENLKKYKGFEVDNDREKEIVFSESKVVMTI